VLIELARCGRRVAAVTCRYDNAITPAAESLALFALSPEER
jgi:hypothetical protein